MGCEVAKERRFVGKAHPFDLLAPPPHSQDDLHYVVNVALGIDATRNRQSDQVHRCRIGEHQGTDLDRPDAAFEVQFSRQCDAGKLRRWDMREESPRIKVNCMATGRLYDW